MSIEFSQPPAMAPALPADILPPIPQEPTPVVDEHASKPQPPKSKPKPVAKHVAKPATQTQARPTESAATPESAHPEPLATPPTSLASNDSSPVTPPSASAGYLRNPPPEYPDLAMRRGWEGTVMLRVHVLSTGRAGDIQVERSSGRDQLDSAARLAVLNWSFTPAKRGDVDMDGWVTVPINFKIK